MYSLFERLQFGHNIFCWIDEVNGTFFSYNKSQNMFEFQFFCDNQYFFCNQNWSCLNLHVYRKQVSQLQYDPNVVDEELQFSTSATMFYLPPPQPFLPPLINMSFYKLIFPSEFDHVCTHVYQFALALKLVPSCAP